jgi:NADH-ubiquinone oxidoreductase chain 4
MLAVITVIYASLATLRTIDVKELIAYSSVCHAAVYLLGAFSNTIQGIEGSIVLGVGHGFVSSGLFICVGGILYDRTHTRLISYYRGVTQIMPLFSLLFFILCLANMGTPLTINFVGEFLSLYGSFERLPLLGGLACSSIVLSAAYTIYLYNRIAFGGSLSAHLASSIPDLNKRELFILLSLIVPTVLLGIYPAPILDGLHYSVSTLIYSNEVDFQPLSLAILHSIPLGLVSDSKNKNLESDFVQWFVGFTDAEGLFAVYVDKSGLPKLSFRITLHMDDLAVLEFIQKKLGTGVILKSRDTFVYYISKIEELESKLFPIFDSFPLNTSKNLDYLIFKKVYYLKKSKTYRTPQGLSAIKKILSQLNNNRTDFTQPKDHSIRITPGWVIGFIEGDGNFYIQRKKTSFIFRMSICQTAAEVKVMEAILVYLHNLWLEQSNKLQITSPNLFIRDEKPRSSNHQLAKLVIVHDLSYIYLILIPLFNSLVFRSKKALDYKD